MATSSVVVLQPGVKGRGASVVRGERLPVGPLGLQGAVESLCFTVLPGAVGFDELLSDAVRGADLAQRPAVGPGVVGEQSFDADDAVPGEVADRALEERGAGRSLLVGEDLGVRQPGVVVDDRVNVVEPDPRRPVSQE